MMVDASLSPTIRPSVFDFDSAVENSSLSVSINLAEGRHLTRRKNDGAEAALAHTGDVLGID